MAVIVARLEAIGNHDEIRPYQLFITFASRPRPRYFSRPVAHDHDRGGGYELMGVVPMTRLFNLPDISCRGEACVTPPMSVIRPHKPSPSAAGTVTGAGVDDMV